MRKLWGRDVFLWDNNPLLFANQFAPLSGRDAALHEEVSGYVANLNEYEAQWRAERNAEFTLITAALYAWNPPAYRPDEAAAAARAAIGKGLEAEAGFSPASRALQTLACEIPRNSATPPLLG
jgi:hypothetical protein